MTTAIAIDFDAPAIPQLPVRPYDELEREMVAAQSLAVQVLYRALSAEIERDMLARRLHEMTNPPITPEFERMGHDIAHACRQMQRQGIM